MTPRTDRPTESCFAQCVRAWYYSRFGGKSGRLRIYSLHASHSCSWFIHCWDASWSRYTSARRRVTTWHEQWLSHRSLGLALVTMDFTAVTVGPSPDLAWPCNASTLLLARYIMLVLTHPHHMFAQYCQRKLFSANSKRETNLQRVTSEVKWINEWRKAEKCCHVGCFTSMQLARTEILRF